ncbi:methyl-accepting chemotaxis protein [Glaciecola sp. XM2]|jgi:methyl-accepting chemotaxis protein|uniref:methyl-accepting chemotaxis protein n=1 Tax=Glaciecola sp. XM2 TaxID=1914931 RepID=UPI001BDEF7AD|nr:methyl-accepting chemotaxis protein [Glaciecola sp. XM2]MBT1451804.1 methyl-accepting chemotaxis protein [Glaciecola sp. XM2]
MKVKQKLISIAVLVSGSLAALSIVFFALNAAVSNNLSEATNLSNRAVASSGNTEASLRQSQQELDTLANRLSDATAPLEQNKQRLAILERKSASFVVRMDELKALLEESLEELEPNGEGTFIIEDAIFELEDIQSQMQRDLTANIQTTGSANSDVANTVIEKSRLFLALNARFTSAFDELVAVNADNVQNNARAIETIGLAAAKQTRNSFILSAAIMVITAVIIGAIVYIILLVTRPLQSIVSDIEKVSSGDFTTRFKVNKKDEFGTVAYAMNKMVATTKALIEDIANESQSLTKTASDMEQNSIATTNAILSEQNDIQEVVAATGQMLSTVQSVAKASSETLASSKESGEAAQAGITIVQSNIEKVNELAAEFNRATDVVMRVEQHAVEIDSILGVIKDITEQTNLLALNAAIEAARAGEQGRGFAVVADEVRQLALRTQSSTTEITEIIARLHESSQNAVSLMKSSEHGVSDTTVEAQKVKDVFNAIMQKIDDIQSRIEMVASASNQQSAVSSIVQNKMQKIEQETEKVKEMAEQVVTQSSSLRSVSKNIASHLDQFII